MELAHVVYRVSTDEEYAEQFRSDPETSVERLGLELSKNEMASLISLLRGGAGQDILSKADRGMNAVGWT